MYQDEISRNNRPEEADETLVSVEIEKGKLQLAREVGAYLITATGIIFKGIFTVVTLPFRKGGVTKAYMRPEEKGGEDE